MNIEETVQSAAAAKGLQQTIRLYETDGERRVFEAVVIACVTVLPEQLKPEDGKQLRSWIEAHPGQPLYAAALDQTAFFPEGGGQDRDEGWLDGEPVLGLAEQHPSEEDPADSTGVIWHLIGKEQEIGKKITGEIDWNFRFDRMQQHTGEHIFSGLVHARFGWNNVGFRLGDAVTTMDFDGVLSPEDVSEIELAANQAIWENRQVKIHFPDENALETLEYRSKIELQGHVRIVEVEGYDLCACCAPHLSRTGSVGSLKVIDAQHYKGGMRISIVCGRRALDAAVLRQRQTKGISALLSVPEGDCLEGVEKLQAGCGELRQRLVEQNMKIAQMELEQIRPESTYVWIFRDMLEPPMMRRMVNEALSRMQAPKACGIFVGSDADGYRWIIGAGPDSDTDARQLLEQIRQGLDAAQSIRGGGSDRMTQGSAWASREKLLLLLPEGQLL